MTISSERPSGPVDGTQGGQPVPFEDAWQFVLKVGAVARRYGSTPGSRLSCWPGNLLGTVVATVFSNLWARWTGRPTSMVLIPAIVLLVSGNIGFRGLASVAAGQLVVGQQFLQMFVVALTIAAGLLIGNTVVRPEKTL